MRIRTAVPVAFAACLMLLGGCATVEVAPTSQPEAPRKAPTAQAGKGGYYLDDGPGEAQTVDLEAVPDAVPKLEPLHGPALRPYTALGQAFTPMTRLQAYKAEGTASWYGRRYHGKATATGERYDMYAMTAAHPTLPLPSYARVTSAATGKSVVVRVNDRGPFRRDRLIDLSYVAAWRLGLVTPGSGPVQVEAILPPGAAGQEVSEPAAGRALADPIPATRGMFLQFGAFTDRNLAEEFANRMRADIPDLAQPIGVYADGGLYKVQSGPFPTRESALAEARRVAEQFGGDAFVAVR